MEQKTINSKKPEFEARVPDFKNDGVAVWINTDKNNKKYLTIKIVGHNTITVFE
jgi:hypothetical protein